VELAVLHDAVQPVVVLQHRDVGEGVAVDEQEIGEVPGLHLAQLVGPQHDLATPCGGGDDRLHRREAEQLDEVLQVPRVGAVRGPSEAVVAAREDLDADGFKASETPGCTAPSPRRPTTACS
jgi:hypothetical protein